MKQKKKQNKRNIFLEDGITTTTTIIKINK
jgi:hypothetical protein